VRVVAVLVGVLVDVLVGTPVPCYIGGRHVLVEGRSCMGENLAIVARIDVVLLTMIAVGVGWTCIVINDYLSCCH